MMYCFAVDCKNDSSKTKGISYHRFPKDPMLCKGWLAKISRENAKILPTKDSVVCFEYLIPDCFQRKLRAKLMGTSKERLNPGPVPRLSSRIGHLRVKTYYMLKFGCSIHLVPVKRERPGRLIFCTTLNSSTFEQRIIWITNLNNLIQNFLFRTSSSWQQ